MRWERLEAFERAEDRGDPGPVGGEVQGGAPGVAGEWTDVGITVSQPLGLTELVLAVEGEQLRPDGNVVCGQASSSHAMLASKL